MTDDIQARVQRGIALLDERVPGWREKVDVEKLETESLCDCVLGQLFGSFGKGMNELGVAKGDAAKAHGFGAFGVDAGVDEDVEFAALTRAWREALQ